MRVSLLSIRCARHRHAFLSGGVAGGGAGPSLKTALSESAFGAQLAEHALAVAGVDGNTPLATALGPSASDASAGSSAVSAASDTLLEKLVRGFEDAFALLRTVQVRPALPCLARSLRFALRAPCVRALVFAGATIA